jgi:hypothetical protein
VLHSVSHVALAVERLREAEEHYRRLFALEVAFREAQTADELRRLRDLAPPAGCLIVSSRADEALIIEDRFGVRWELNSFDYDDLRRLSSGVRTGRWLTV